MVDLIEVSMRCFFFDGDGFQVGDGFLIGVSNCQLFYFILTTVTAKALEF